MSENKNNDKSPKDEQPWERGFGEKDPKARAYSRSARNGKGRAQTSLTSVLLFVFLIVVVSPILFMMWFYWSNQRVEVTPRTADEVMLTKVVETTTAETTTTAAEETTAAPTTQAATTAVPTDPARQQTAQTTAEQQTTQQGEYGTYTVQPGETLYRIAVNHGMDVATLKSINGLTGDNISPGMQLRVLQARQ